MAATRAVGTSTAPRSAHSGRQRRRALLRRKLVRARAWFRPAVSADLPVAGCPRFTCEDVSCGRRILVEQVAGLTRRYSQRTERMRSTLSRNPSHRPRAWSASTSTRCARAVPTGPCWSTSRPADRWTSCRIARQALSRPGWPSTLGPRPSAATAPRSGRGRQHRGTPRGSGRRPPPPLAKPRRRAPDRAFAQVNASLIKPRLGGGLTWARTEHRTLTEPPSSPGASRTTSSSSTPPSRQAPKP